MGKRINLENYTQEINPKEQDLTNITSKTENRKGDGNFLYNLGYAYYFLGDYTQAIKYQEQSLSIARETKNKQREGESLGNLGLTYYGLGEYNEAIKYQKQSLSIARETKNKQREGESLGNLGDVYYRLGDYTQAINYQKQSLSIARETKNKQHEGESLGNLGDIYYALGDYTQAIKYQKQSLSIARETKDRLGERKALRNLELAYNSVGDYTQAINYQKQSLSIAREIKDKLDEGQFLTNLENIDDALEDYKQAIKYQESSLAIFRQTKDRLGEGESLDNLGNAYYALKDYKQAIKYQEQRLALSREMKDKESEGNVLNHLGSTLLDSGNPQAAEINLRNAMTIWESISADSKNNHPFKSSILETQANSYRLLQKSLIAQNKTTAALEISERSRTRTLNKLLTQRQKLSLSNTSPNIQQIKKIAQQENATLVEYSIAGNDLYIWVVKPNGEIIFHKVDLKNINVGDIAKDIRMDGASLAETRGKALITGLVRSTRQALISNHQPTNQDSKLGCRGNDCLRKLYDLLIQPIAADLPTNPDSLVIFIPHESLFLVPFAALQDQNLKFLIAKHTLAIASSIQVLELTNSISPGVPNVTVSLWSVRDGSTSDLMPEFYCQLKDNPNQASALRQAMLKTMSNYPQPKDWAAFILIGEAN